MYNIGIILILTFIIILTILIDKLFNKFKITTFIIHIWVGIWNVIKSMGNWKGVISLLITWLILSGSGLIIIGWIFAIKKLVIIGISIYGFWLLPLTPLIPITIMIAMLIQKFVFVDKNVSIKNIKERFKEGMNEND